MNSATTNSSASPALQASVQAALQKRAQQALARRSLASFSTYCCDVTPAKHHQILCTCLQMAIEGYMPRVMVFMPPGGAKSTYASVCAPSWAVGRRPGIALIAGSHTRALAKTFGRRVRNTIRDPRYREVFPTVLDPNSSAAHEWHTFQTTEGDRRQATYFAAGVGTGIAGRRADLAIIDDPFKSRKEADSPIQRETVWNWYLDDVRTRLKPEGAIIVINCLTGDTPITMADGTRRRLDSVRAGDMVLACENGRQVPRAVLNWAEQPADDILELRTGNHRIRGNARHPVLIEENGEHQWRRLGDIKRGDRVVVSRAEHASDSAALTEREAWLLGFMLGDGWVTINRKRNEDKIRNKRYATQSWVTCCAVGRYSERNTELAEAFSTVFGVSPKLTKFGYLRTEVARVGRWFYERGIKGGAKGKRVPGWIFRQPIEVRRAFVDGFAKADGSESKTGRVSIGVSNRGLAEDIRHLARSCGYNVTNLYYQKITAQPPNSPKPVDGEIWAVRWQNTTTDDAFGIATVRSVLPVGCEKVYDVQVDGAENFIADGIVTHNTRWHEDDLCGRILPEGYAGESGWIQARDGEWWFVISIQALAERDDDLLGRAVGESYWPEYFSRAWLEQQRITLTPRSWGALYQQRPAPDEGDYYKREWFQWYDELPAHVRHYGASDYAVTDNGGDWTVHLVGAVAGPAMMENLYLCDYWTGRTDSSVWIQEFVDLVLRWKPVGWAEEQGQISKSLGSVIDLEQQRQNAWCVRSQMSVSGDKAQRAQAFRALAAQKRVYLPRRAPWAKDFLDRLVRFGATTRDDDHDAAGLLGRLAFGMRGGKEIPRQPGVPKAGTFDYLLWVTEQQRGAQRSIYRSR